jgi:hypothetical protein
MQELSGGNEELVIDAAMEKRKESVKAYEKEGVNVKALVLIRLPDRKTSLEDRVKERVEKILKKNTKSQQKKELGVTILGW